MTHPARTRAAASRPVLFALHLLLAWALIAVFPTPRAIAQSPDPATFPAIDATDLAAFLDEFVPAHLVEEQIPGVTLAVVQGERMILSRGYGLADVARGIPVDPARSLFRTGSVGKLVTWTAVMQLAEQGRVDLHADVNDYLDFTIPATFDAPITLAHLLTHTPGFADAPDGLFVFNAADVPSLGDYLRRNLPERVFAPGLAQAYSNYGTGLAGYIVERVSGQSFADYVEEHIFTPLGMTHSTVRQPVPAALAPNQAVGYGVDAGTFLPGEFIFVGPHPAGTMNTTAEDMAAFMLAHLNQGRYGDFSLLQPETVALMQQHHYSLDPRLDGMAYGWMEQRAGAARVLQHRGSILQFHAGVYLLPAAELGLFFSYNGLNGGAVNHVIWEAILSRYYPATDTAASATWTPAAAADLAPYVGEYHLARGQFSGPGKVLNLFSGVQVAASADGRLALSMEGANESFVMLEPGLFRRVEQDGQLAFVTDAEGRQWLAADGELAFPQMTATAAFRVPWFATMPVALLLVLGGLLLFLGSALGWGIAALLRRRRGAPPPPLARLRQIALLCGVLLLGFLVALALVFTDIDPRYGVPRLFFGDTAGVYVVRVMPWALLIAAPALAGLTLHAWRLGRGSLLGRLHHTLLSVFGLALVAWFWYWELLGL